MPGAFPYRTIFHVMASNPGRDLRCPKCGGREVHFMAENELSIAECFGCDTVEVGRNSEGLFFDWSQDAASGANTPHGIPPGATQRP